jgi:exopolysaccharide production protein ExoQ
VRHATFARRRAAANGRKSPRASIPRQEVQSGGEHDFDEGGVNDATRMSTASMRSVRSREAAPVFDKRLIVPILTCAYCFIIGPLVEFEHLEIGTANQIVWPLLAGIALACFASGDRSRLIWPPHILWLAAYCALAGASLLWALNPGISRTRFSTEMMLIISMVLPAMVAARRSEMMHGVFYCFAFGSILNAIVILTGYSTILMAGTDDAGYVGYMEGKNALGQFAAVAILFSVYEIVRPGWRRWLALIIIFTDVYLIFGAHSKAALAFILMAAILAKLVLFIGKRLRVSPALVLLPVPLGYAVLSRIVGNLADRLSWYIFHNYDLSGRTDIWWFVDLAIAKRPLLGWGYRSVWLVGANSPMAVGGWIGEMPEAHNGYKETILDTGYIGLFLFLVFILTSVHAIGRVADRDPVRGWFLLSIALFCIFENFVETGWMHGGDGLWLVFVLIVVEAGLYWQPFRAGRPEAGVAPRRPVLSGAGGTDSDRLRRRQDIWM